MGTRRPDVGDVGPAGTGPSPLGRASVVSPLPRAVSLVAAVLVVFLIPVLASAEEEPKEDEATREVEEGPPTEDGGDARKAGRARKTTIRFRPVDVFLDSGDARLAAYQVEVRYDKSRVKIVGVEGADAEEAEGFNPPPYYDHKGMDAGRIVIAAFVTDDLLAPAGRTRVATLHLRVEGELKDERRGEREDELEGEPVAGMSVRLVTAARPGGERIAPEVELVGREVEKPADAPKGGRMAETPRAGAGADGVTLTKPDADPPERVDVASPSSGAEEVAEDEKEGSER